MATPEPSSDPNGHPLATRRGPCQERYKQNVLLTSGFVVPLTCHNTNLSPLVNGRSIRIPDRHAKTRRAGYRRTGTEGA